MEGRVPSLLTIMKAAPTSLSVVLSSVEMCFWRIALSFSILSVAMLR